MPERILVVDDEPDLELLIRQRFRRQIRAGEWEFVFATDGEDALERLTDDASIACVLTDLNMPRMDGLTLLGRLREEERLCRTVVVSAYGDLGNIRTAMNRGAFDFVTKPIDFADLELTIRKTIEDLDAHRRADESRAELEAIRRELEVARQIQEAVLLRTFPERSDVDLYAYLTPAREVGGDFYDYFFLDGDRLGVVVADVSGKGIAAAFLMAVSRTLLKGTAFRIKEPAACVRTVNGLLYPQTPRHMFVTLFYGVLDLRTGTFDYCNAGHNAPYRVRDGVAEPLPRTRGLAVALADDFAYESATIGLEPGDALVLYTDGVVEATDHGGEQFDEGRLQRSIAEASAGSSAALVREVVRAVAAFANGAPPRDDVTVLAARYLGRPNAE